MMLLNRRWTSLAIQFFTLFCLNATWAQTYPTKPISMVVAVSPGGATDIAARLVASKLSERLGQPVIVENRPGAAQSIGSEFVAKSPADGYTLIMGTVSSHAINAPLYRNLRYSIANDFVAISQVTSQPLLLVVHPTVPANSVTELLQLLKANPDKYSYGSAGGVGTSGHMSAELFKMKTGSSIAHIPYQGSGPMNNDLIGGQIQLAFDNMPTAIANVRSGRLRALGITSQTRSSVAPEIPSIAEYVPGFNVSAWQGIFAPVGTPTVIVNKLSAEVQQIMKMPDVIARMQSMGTAPVGSSSTDFSAFVKEEIARWTELVKSSGISIKE